MSVTRSSAYLVAANLLTFLIQLVAIRFFVQWIGESDYGAVVLVTTVSTYVALFSPSSITAAQLLITQALKKGEDDFARAVNRTQATMNFAILGGIALVFVGLAALYEVPQKDFDRPTVALMFAAAFVSQAISLVNQNLVPVLSALGHFRTLAIRLSLDKLVGAVTGLAFAYIYRSPVAVLWGTAIGNFAGLAVNFLTVAKVAPEFRFAPGWNRNAFGEIRNLLFHGHPHRVLSGIGNSVDRLLFPFWGLPLASLTHYSLASRVPETLQLILGPITEPVVPELTRHAVDDPPRFAAALDRYGRTAMGVGAAIILPVCGAASPLMKLWLGFVPPGGAIVAMGVGFYFAVQLYMTMMSRAFFSTGKLLFAAVFTGFNSLLALVLTIGAVRTFGIAGLGALKAGIAACQFVPYAFFVRRHAAPQFAASAHAAACVGMVASGVLAMLGLAMIPGWPALVAAAPVGAALLAIYARAGWMTPPEAFRRRLGFLLR